jgi:hypothetical protein
MPLFRDLDLGEAGDGSEARTIGVGASLEVVLFAVDGHDDIGVLFDASAVAQVRELRPLVGAILDLAAQLRRRQHRHVEFLDQRLQAARDLGDFLHAAVTFGRAFHQLRIVDDDQTEPLRALQPPRLSAKRQNGKAGRLVDEQRASGSTTQRKRSNSTELSCPCRTR